MRYYDLRPGQPVPSTYWQEAGRDPAYIIIDICENHIFGWRAPATKSRTKALPVMSLVDREGTKIGSGARLGPQPI